MNNELEVRATALKLAIDALCYSGPDNPTTPQAVVSCAELFTAFLKIEK